VIERLRAHDGRFVVHIRRGKGSHRMIWHPDIGGRAESFPLKHHGDSTEIRKGTLAALIRRFNLPREIFD
jgi:predicted RNA binding protein YcfA (HicA-like mRNA interferase family)